MSDRLTETAAAFRAALAQIDPDRMSGVDSARLAEDLATIEKMCGTVRLLLSARAIGAGAHRERGFSDGAAWLARHSGSTGGAARRALRTAQSLEGCQDTKAALLAGQISLPQATEA